MEQRGGGERKKPHCLTVLTSVKDEGRKTDIAVCNYAHTYPCKHFHKWDTGRWLGRHLHEWYSKSKKHSFKNTDLLSRLHCAFNGNLKFFQDFRKIVMSVVQRLCSFSHQVQDGNLKALYHHWKEEDKMAWPTSFEKTKQNSSNTAH